MKKFKLCVVMLTALILFPSAVLAQQITLYAAGSLRAALTDVAKAFEEETGNVVNTEFAPSGLLRQRIEQGEEVNVFASANMQHPHTLVEQGQEGPVALFTRNNLCGLAQPDVTISSNTLLEVILDSDIRLGTSTPEADPSGDYAWELFHKAEEVKPGSFDKLDAKAMKLTGGPDTPTAPEGRNLYAWVMQEDRADVFLTYCTNAVLARNEAPELEIIQVPQELSVGADYGLIVLDGSPVEAWRLAMFILAPEGQKILADYGFISGALPAE